jgi:hypothetical protein
MTLTKQLKLFYAAKVRRYTRYVPNTQLHCGRLVYSNEVLTARPLHCQSGRVSIHGWAAGADSEAARLARHNPGARVALLMPCGDCRGIT